MNAAIVSNMTLWRSAFVLGILSRRSYGRLTCRLLYRVLRLKLARFLLRKS